VRAQLLTKKGTILDEDTLERDVLLMTAFYYDAGFVQVDVGEPRIVESAAGEAVDVTITVAEGDIYRIGTISVAGALIAPPATYMNEVKTKPRDIFNRARLAEDIQRINELHRARGAQGEVTPETVVHPDKKTVDIVFRVAGS
jgi:outer membrane protein insertion porin family